MNDVYEAECGCRYVAVCSEGCCNSETCLNPMEHWPAWLMTTIEDGGSACEYHQGQEEAMYRAIAGWHRRHRHRRVHNGDCPCAPNWQQTFDIPRSYYAGDAPGMTAFKLGQEEKVVRALLDRVQAVR